MIVDLPADCWPVASLILSVCRDPGVRPWKQLLKVLGLLRASKSVSEEQFFTATWPIFYKRFPCEAFTGVTGLSGPPVLFSFSLYAMIHLTGKSR